MKPFIKWAGGKTQLIPIIDDMLPDFIINRHAFNYVEPFIGGGALFFHLVNKYNMQSATLIDKNSVLINTYKIIKDDIKITIKELSELKASFLCLENDKREEFYYQKRDEYNKTSDIFYKSLLFLFLNKTCFNGLYRENSSGLFNVPYGQYKNPSIFDEIHLLEVSSLLNKVDVELVVDDFSFCLSKVDNVSNNFIYFDPPYIPLNSTSSFTSYTQGGFGENEHARLSEVYKKLSTQGYSCLLSNSANELNDTLYKDYSIELVDAKRMINSDKNKRGKIKEAIITNYKYTEKDRWINQELLLAYKD